MQLPGSKKQYFPMDITGRSDSVTASPFSLQFSDIVQLPDMKILFVPLRTAWRDIRFPDSVSTHESMVSDVNYGAHRSCIMKSDEIMASGDNQLMG